jgi:hypothetical protein
MLKKTDRVKVFGHAGTIVDLFARWEDDDQFAAAVQTDNEVSFGDVRGNILIMQLSLGGAKWGADYYVERTVGVDLCPNLDSWFQRSGCVQLNSHLVYEVL